MRRLTLGLLTLLSTPVGLPSQERTFTHADTLRGSYTTPGRVWWDVTFYDLHVTITPADSAIRGRAVTFRRDGNAFFAQLEAPQPQDATSMGLTREEHQVFTHAWRAAIPYGERTLSASKDEVLGAARRIYKTVVQLTLSTVADSELLMNDHPYRLCARCERRKYLPFVRGCFPRFANPPTGHALKSREFFGDGAKAYREVVISHELYAAISAAQVKGCTFTPLCGEAADVSASAQEQ